MQEFCPLCMKNGIKTKVKAFQVNLKEALWVCERKECIWPFGYEELIFFERPAMSYNWDESDLTKDYISVSTELSLYTPPVTPGRESNELSFSTEDTKLSEIFPKNNINLQEDFMDFNKSSPLGGNKLKSNITSEENKSIKKEKNASINASRMLPKVINIQKTNFNITTIIPNGKKCFNNQKIQEHKNSNVNITSTMDNIGDDASFDDIYKELRLSTQYEKENKCSKSDESLHQTMNLDTNFNIETSNSLSLEANLNIRDSLDATNNSTLNTSDDLDIDTILEEVLSDENYITKHIDGSWLDFM